MKGIERAMPSIGPTMLMIRCSILSNLIADHLSSWVDAMDAVGAAPRTLGGVESMGVMCGGLCPRAPAG
jgi:hypothetical protein